MGIEDVMEKPGFWILGVGGTAMVLMGWIMSRRAGWITMPLWQVLLTILVIWGASVAFSARD